MGVFEVNLAQTDFQIHQTDASGSHAPLEKRHSMAELMCSSRGALASGFRREKVCVKRH